MELSALSLRCAACPCCAGCSSTRLSAPIWRCSTRSAARRGVRRRYGALCRRSSPAGTPRALLDAVHFDVNTLTDTIDDPAPAVLARPRTTSRRCAPCSRWTAPRSNPRPPRAWHARAAGLPDFPAPRPCPSGTAPRSPATTARRATGFSPSPRLCRAGRRQVRPSRTRTIRLRDLPGYERQKQQILKNTLAFLDGREANNILLYGDKGTGKSSTVKAVVNEYAERGLKIIEMSPRHITCFPKIFAETLRSPFKFIVFLDDLSFSREDDNFAALKAFIEGGLAGKPANLVIYATSNRRHLIRESFADREGDEVRVRDSLETVTSLSDRFGLEITFSVPDRDEYLYIVDQLAAESGVDLPGEQLHLLAERFALRRNGRSPRTARQFISQQLAEKYDRKL